MKKPKINRLLYDLEVSPNVGLFWQASRKQWIPYENILLERSIICICYKWEGQKTVHSLEWDNGCDKKLLEEFMEVALKADEMIAHNGDKFDLKWFNTRCLYHGLQPPPTFKTVDTLVIAKRRFLFNSNRLDYLGQLLFGAGKIKTEFSMWKDILIDNCPKAMAKMVRYCKQDVRLLERVWKALQPYHVPKTHVGTLNGGEKWMCPFTGSTNVRISSHYCTAAGTPRHTMFSRDAGAYYTINDKSLRDYQAWKREIKKRNDALHGYPEGRDRAGETRDYTERKNRGLLKRRTPRKVD